MSRLRQTPPAPVPHSAVSQPGHPVVEHATRAGGHALDPKTRNEMSARFGHDFSQVRVHTDSRAQEGAEMFGANAFTVGSDIVFGEGKFQPGSAETDRLLAHELTHVVQQERWGGLGDEGRLSSKGDASEREAHHASEKVLRGERVEVSVAPQAAVARDGDDGGGGGFWHNVAEGASGLAYGTMQGLTPGGFAAPSPDPHSRAFEFFRGAGQIATGAAETLLGAGGEVAGVGLDATGAGAVAGVPLNVVSAMAMANGVVGAGAGIGTMINAMTMSGDGSGSGGPGPYRTPGERSDPGPTQPAGPNPQGSAAVAQRNLSAAQGELRDVQRQLNNTPTTDPAYQDLVQQRNAAQQKVDVAQSNLDHYGGK